MRNLRNTRYSSWGAPSDITATCWDAGTDETLVTFGPSETDTKIELVRVTGQTASSSQFQCKPVASWEAPSPNPDLAVEKVVDIHHFGDSLTTCLVLAGGDIITVQEDEGSVAPSGEAHVEIVGSIDATITAARWSPDEELLAITTDADTVVLMSRSFDVVAEATMIAEDLKASKHVSVGWGKKETQFQGRGARALRDPTIPERVDEGTMSPNDDGRTTISWRGDGAYLAINSVGPGSRRVIRVYQPVGVLDSVSEPVDGLEGALSWRPSGNLLAGVQRFADRVDIVFFERNGLRHGQFTLRIPHDTRGSAEQIALEWNSDSTVLAVVLKDRIQLWTMGNYHWYLKQDIFTGSQRATMAWHPEKALRFAASTSGNMLLTEYAFSTSRGSLTPPHDHGAVAVIDGQTVKLTPFRTANIPPPMAMFELTAASAVIDVAFALDNSALAILHHFGVDYYAWKTKGSRSIAPALQEKLEFSKAEAALYVEAPLQVTLPGQGRIQLLQYHQSLSILSYDIGKSKSWTETTAESVSTIGSFSGATGVRTFGQELSGKLLEISEEDQEALSVNFPTQMPWTEIVRHDGQNIAFGLSRSGHLYANSRQLAKNCTSFLVTPLHLIFTTSNHFLKFVHLASAEELEVPLDDPEVDERCRSIERGARLVTAIPTNMNLILQMPRGNLETIAPRAMVVAGIRRLIDEKNYGSAFAYCRTQRVDMNILCDHQPEQFLSNVGLFLDQIDDVTYIDLFLSALKEEDVSQTMYKDTTKLSHGNNTQFSFEAPKSSPSNLPSTGASKINSICDAVLEALRSRKKPNPQNIITAHVCKKPPALNDGLHVVSELMQEDEALAERAVEHICFLVDVNRLYDHALGLYGLDLALLVAQQSQRDPREYVPFIQNLHRMPQLRRQFAIDDHLGRREKALGHLQALNAFEEVRTYTTKHGLYQAALNLYRYDEQHLRILTDSYALHLESNSKFREAGLAYESIGNFAKATSCYRGAGATSWRECLFSAQQQTPPLSGSALSQLASDLADALYEAKDYAAAATIHADYLDSVETAARCLCKGYLFSDAMRLVTLKNRPDLLETAVDGGLADGLSNSTEFLADCKAQLKAQVPRILELRRKAVEDPLGFYEGERPFGSGAGGDIPDDISVAASSRLSTSASLFTRYTGKGGGSVGTLGSNVSRATSKNRKREEKKRARGRKGTVYEEEYLVNSVRRLVERVEGTRDEVERLVFDLTRRRMAERARAVEALAAEVVESCRAAIKEVWPPVVEDERVAGEGEGAAYGYRPVGGDAVLQDSLIARSVRQEPPTVSSFARLSILG